MKSIYRYLRPKEWALAGVVIAFVIIQTWFALELPERMFIITKLVQTPDSPINEVWKEGMYMIVCAIGSFLATVAARYAASRVAAVFSQRLRSMQFSKVSLFSMNEINKFSIASLITRSTNDVTQVQVAFTAALQAVTMAPILAAGAFLKIWGMGFEWTLATSISLVCIVALFILTLVLVMPKFKMMQSLTDNINRVAREGITGLSVIRAYNAEDYQKIKFERANEELTGTTLYTTRAMAALMPAIALIMNGLLIAIYWIGAIVISSAGSDEVLTLFSNMVVLSSYAAQIVMAIMTAMSFFIMIPRAQVAAKRINDVINTEPSIKGGTVISGNPNLKGTVEFRNVCFRYPGATDYALRDVNFTAKQGETIAFIGSTGSGKSTLINLVPRLCDVTEGQILIDGVDVREYSLEALYDKIGYVPQRSVLFSGTVTSNVAFGGNSSHESTDNDVKNAVRTAQGQDFVEKMDGRYESEISRSGINLSGGQKQRLSIARAVYKRPEIYIFDDSFSAIDYKTDRALRTALKKEARGVTSMIVAQRIGTIMDADRIVVLDKGRIVGIGNHRGLLRTCSVYKEIAMSQFNEGELET
ncbi:MAG: ABC transporter ATP-binding protein/permease [Candidatus Methanoplasma sp.]|jgi:ATP-binding cassette subfamily B protein|nr:ABC transporter ATP-binding protein/permease [Candidatus Methanoplasma sp.]